MQTLERETSAVGLTEPDWTVPGSWEPGTVGRYVRWILALCSLGAAVVHFSVMAGHYTVAWAHGTFFAVAGWTQVALAVALVRSRRRWVLGATALLNLAIIGVWVMSRTVGVPIGPDAWTPEKIEFADTLSTILEGVLVVGALAALSARVERRPLSSEVGISGTVALGAAIALLSTLAFTPALAGTAGHTHGHAGATTLAAAGAGGAGHVHDHSSGGAAGGHDHGVVGSPGLVKTAAGTIVTGALTGQSPCEKSGPPASVGQVGQDAEGHNHRGPILQQSLAHDQFVQLQAQQAQARAVTLRYPTVADAEKAGYTRSTPYVPCIGAHYTNPILAVQFNPAAPSELLFDGTRPDSKIVGLSYLVWHPGGPPEGFAGPNDHWHQHNINGGLCFKGAVVIGAESTSAAECRARGGVKSELKDIWMLHDWVVPGYECSWGVFAPECPELGGRIGGTAFDPPAPQAATTNKASGS